MNEKSFKKPIAVDTDKPCRKCSTLMKMQKHDPRRLFPAKQEYYFTQWLYCGGCRSIYLDEKYKLPLEKHQKRIVIEEESRTLDMYSLLERSNT